VTADISKKKEADRLIQKAVKAFGGVDVLFNNAATFNAIGPVWRVDPQTWWSDVTVNLCGPFLCCRAVLPHMMKKNRGIIINMNGGGAVKPLTGGSGYGTSKAALLRLTDTLARELALVRSKVMVFALGPGLVRTAATMRQATTRAGLAWIPSTREAFDKKQDRPPEDCAKKAVELIHYARPALSGRIFGVDTDFRKAGYSAWTRTSGRLSNRRLQSGNETGSPCGSSLERVNSHRVIARPCLAGPTQSHKTLKLYPNIVAALLAASFLWCSVL
jgi:NAD(P)-dependent dehydrogenase (short-subunit alcohol dehydrogenase family)